MGLLQDFFLENFNFQISSEIKIQNRKLIEKNITYKSSNITLEKKILLGENLSTRTK